LDDEGSDHPPSMPESRVRGRSRLAPDLRPVLAGGSILARRHRSPRQSRYQRGERAVMAQSGNRPPRRGQSPTRGSQPPSNGRAAPDDAAGESAAERARERLAQQRTSGQKRQTASQRARSAAPPAQRTRAGSPPAGRGRAGGAASRRAPAKDAPKRSTAMTAAIFATALV